jgi:hypothetical protein
LNARIDVAVFGEGGRPLYRSGSFARTQGDVVNDPG